jgi:hypothetical protein
MQLGAPSKRPTTELMRSLAAVDSATKSSCAVRSPGTWVFHRVRTGSVSRRLNLEVGRWARLQPTEADQKEHERNAAQNTARGMKPPPPGQKFSSSFAAWIETWIQ